MARHHHHFDYAEVQRDQRIDAFLRREEAEAARVRSQRNAEFAAWLWVVTPAPIKIGLAHLVAVGSAVHLLSYQVTPLLAALAGPVLLLVPYFYLEKFLYVGAYALLLLAATATLLDHSNALLVVPGTETTATVASLIVLALATASLVQPAVSLLWTWLRAHEGRGR